MSSDTGRLLPSRSAYLANLNATHRTATPLAFFDLASANTIDIDDCAICTEPLGSTAVALHGKHRFCLDCAETWLANHDTCPLCRAQLFEPDTDLLEDDCHPDIISGPIDHDTVLDVVGEQSARLASAHGQFWFLGRDENILSTIATVGSAWGTGMVNIGPVVPTSPYVPARTRRPHLSTTPRSIDSDLLTTSLTTFFMQCVVDALRERRWHGPELHPLTWQVFGLMLRVRFADLSVSAETLEDALERHIWRRVRLPGVEADCSPEAWYSVHTMEERGELPGGTRDFVLDMLEQVIVAHEDSAPEGDDVVARREPAL